MPSDDQDQTSSQAERLSRKIERLQTGQPSPVHDGDTEELAELARLLMVQLDKSQPDPHFRLQLKQDLIDPGPRLVSFQPRSGPRRYPVPALFGALTVVLVASAVTGWMVFADQGGGSEQAMNRVARFATATPTTASATGAFIAASGVATQEPNVVKTRTSAALGDAETETLQAAPDETLETQATAAVEAPATSPQRAVVELPPVDARHVELGALATVVAPSAAVQSDVVYSQTVDPATLELERVGIAYQFSSPYVEPELILRGVQEFLGIEAKVEQRERGGKIVYALSSAEGAINFTWSPDSGAFSCTLPDPYSMDEIEDLSAAAVQWLQEFGFPVGKSGVSPVIQTNDDGQTFIHVPIGNSQLPNPAVGHPMSITLVVDAEGRIVSVSGYWLEVTSQSEVALVTAAQAWERVLAGGGYWPEGAEPRAAGEFVATHFEVGYMLTSSESPATGLALQPVIAISGSFFPADGSASYSTTVYVQGMAAL
jgi:hypothetical protein